MCLIVVLIVEDSLPTVRSGQKLVGSAEINFNDLPATEDPFIGDFLSAFGPAPFTSTFCDILELCENRRPSAPLRLTSRIRLSYFKLLLIHFYIPILYFAALILKIYVQSLIQKIIFRMKTPLKTFKLPCKQGINAG